MGQCQCPSRNDKVNDDDEKTEANKWLRFVKKLSQNKKWANHGHALNFAKNGMPQNIDGPGKGPGEHLREPGCVIGRWGWREIPH